MYEIVSLQMLIRMNDSLAWAEMRLILGVIIRRYVIRPDPSTNEDTMSPVEHFFVVPKSVDLTLLMLYFADLAILRKMQIGEWHAA